MTDAPKTTDGLETGACPKCGAASDERWACCEVEKGTTDYIANTRSPQKTTDGLEERPGEIIGSVRKFYENEIEVLRQELKEADEAICNLYRAYLLDSSTPPYGLTHNAIRDNDPVHVKAFARLHGPNTGTEEKE